MKHYVKEFCRRGLMFGGFGPVIVGIIYAALEHTAEDFTLSGTQVLTAILSVYGIAFVQAGASVFWQIERLSVPKALLCHLSLLYTVYVGCYLINDWIPFEPVVVLVFTAVFLAVYFAVWTVVVCSVKAVTRKLNEKLK